MSIPSWDQRSKPRSPRTSGAAPTRPAFRPRLEGLEDRTLPSLFAVTTTLDGTNVDGSLRQAIVAANQADPADPITIVLPAGQYTLTQPGPGDDGALTGDLDIRHNLTIRGDGAGKTIIDGAGLDRVFQVFAGVRVELDGLTVRGGVARDGQGGGIRNAGDLTLTNCTIAGNEALGDGSQAFAAGAGGGVYSTGNLTAVHCTFAHNRALGGHGTYRPATTSAEVSDLKASGAGLGGAVYVASGSTATFTDGFLVANTATGGDGSSGDGADGFGPDGGAGLGGGVFNSGGTLTLTHTSFKNDAANGGTASPDGMAGRGFGGAFFDASDGSRLTIDHITYLNNAASTGVADAGILSPDGKAKTLPTSGDVYSHLTVVPVSQPVATVSQVPGVTLTVTKSGPTSSVQIATAVYDQNPVAAPINGQTYFDGYADGADSAQLTLVISYSGNGTPQVFFNRADSPDSPWQAIGDVQIDATAHTVTIHASASEALKPSDFSGTVFTILLTPQATETTVTPATAAPTPAGPLTLTLAPSAPSGRATVPTAAAPSTASESDPRVELTTGPVAGVAPAISARPAGVVSFYYQSPVAGPAAGPAPAETGRSAGNGSTAGLVLAPAPAGFGAPRLLPLGSDAGSFPAPVPVQVVTEPGVPPGSGPAADVTFVLAAVAAAEEGEAAAFAPAPTGSVEAATSAEQTHPQTHARGTHVLQVEQGPTNALVAIAVLGTVTVLLASPASRDPFRHLPGRLTGQTLGKE